MHFGIVSVISGCIIGIIIGNPSEAGFKASNYVILNYCIRFAVLPCVRLFLNSCHFIVYFMIDPGGPINFV